MKVVIAGTRYKDPINKVSFDDYTLVVQSIQRSGYTITELVCGMAIGVDRLGEQWAKVNNIPVKEMPATAQEWERYGKAAGPIRNARMADYADAAIVIWDGKSPGSRNMIDEMIKRNKPYYIGMTRSTVEDFFQ